MDAAKWGSRSKSGYVYGYLIIELFPQMSKLLPKEIDSEKLPAVKLFIGLRPVFLGRSFLKPFNKVLWTHRWSPFSVLIVQLCVYGWSLTSTRKQSTALPPWWLGFHMCPGNISLVDIIFMFTRLWTKQAYRHTDNTVKFSQEKPSSTWLRCRPCILKTSECPWVPCNTPALIQDMQNISMNMWKAACVKFFKDTYLQTPLWREGW